MPDMQSTKTPPSTSVSFARGIIARLSIWPALRIAVENNWGGPNSGEKRTWIASVIVDAFEEQNPAPDVPYVEETLLQIMEDEFETELEDGSAVQVAIDIVKLWHEVQSGKLDFMEAIEGRADAFRGKRVDAQQGVTSDNEWESESDDEGSDEQETPHIQPSRSARQTDEEGFTVIKGKGRSHH